MLILLRRLPEAKKIALYPLPETFLSRKLVACSLLDWLPARLAACSLQWCLWCLQLWRLQWWRLQLWCGNGEQLVVAFVHNIHCFLAIGAEIDLKEICRAGCNGRQVSAYAELAGDFIHPGHLGVCCLACAAERMTRACAGRTTRLRARDVASHT